MKRQLTKLLCLMFCVLLLCSCATRETAITKLPELPDNMHNVPEAYADRGIEAAIELFNLLNPDTYVNMVNTPRYRTDGGYDVRISGPGCAEFEASEIATEYFAKMKVQLKYKEDTYDLRTRHKIPRKPDSEVTFDGGVTMKTEHAVYPEGAEFIRYTIECDEITEYEDWYELFKYVDGEWLMVDSPGFISLLMPTFIEPDKPYYNGIRWSEHLGEGLYKIVMCDTYHAEFAVKRNAREVDLPEKYAFRSCDVANVFYRVGLPLNCRITADFSTYWPIEDSSYRIDGTSNYYGHSFDRLASHLMRDPEAIANYPYLSRNDDRAPIIDPYEAAAVVLPELFKLEDDVLIANLEYTFDYRGEDTETLYPTWIFKLECGETEMQISVDARSGELVE